MYFLINHLVLELEFPFELTRAIRRRTIRLCGIEHTTRRAVVVHIFELMSPRGGMYRSIYLLESSRSVGLGKRAIGPP